MNDYVIKIEWYDDVIGERGSDVVLQLKNNYENALNYLLKMTNEYTKEASISKDGVILFTLTNKFDPNP